MGIRKGYLVILIGVMVTTVLAACGGGAAPPPAESGGTGGEAGEGGGTTEEPTPVPTLGAQGAAGKLYLGEILPPHSGPAALYIYQDNSIEMIIATEDVAASMHFNGTLEGQRVNLESEVGAIRATGRVSEGRLDLNITIPGQGFWRAMLNEATEGGALYLGTLNDLTAGLIVLPDGSMAGFAPVEGGDEPVYEALCVEGGESLPPELTATTCDTGEEVSLTIVTD